MAANVKATSCYDICVDSMGASISNDGPFIFNFCYISRFL